MTAKPSATSTAPGPDDSSNDGPPPATTAVGPESSSDTQPPSDASFDLTAVVASLSDDGQVGPQGAETAFDAAFGDAQPGAAFFDGSGPLRWAMATRDELEPETQDLLDSTLADLASPFAGTAIGGGSGLMAHASTTECALFEGGVAVKPVPPDLQVISTTYMELNKEIGAQIGRSPVNRFALCSQAASTRRAAVTGLVYAADGTHTGTADHCVVYVKSADVAEMSTPESAIRLAYAALTCWMATAVPGGSLGEYYARARGAWYLEGAAMWSAAEAALAVTGETGDLLDPFWETYLITPGTPLTGRLYDALGWFAQLEMAEHATWAHLDGVFAARSTAAAWAAAQSGPALSETWPAGYFRDPNRGVDWDIAGPSITGATAEIATLQVANDVSIPLDAAKLAVGVAMVSSSADIVNVTSTGTLRVSDGSIDIRGVDEQYFCTRAGGDCTCPKDTEPIGPAPVALASPFAAGLASGLSANQVATFTGMSLDEFCLPTPSTTTPDEVDPCTLVSDAEVLEVLNVPLARHERNGSGAAQGCVIGTARQPLAGITMADVSYVSVAYFPGTLAMLHDENSGPTTEVKGIGDAAEMINGAGAITIQTGPIVLLVQVVQAGAPASTEVVLQLARLALGRLG